MLRMSQGAELLLQKSLLISSVSDDPNCDKVATVNAVHHSLINLAAVTTRRPPPRWYCTLLPLSQRLKHIYTASTGFTSRARCLGSSWLLLWTIHKHFCSVSLCEVKPVPWVIGQWSNSFRKISKLFCTHSKCFPAIRFAWNAFWSEKIDFPLILVHNPIIARSTDRNPIITRLIRSFSDHILIIARSTAIIAWSFADLLCL